MKKILLAIIMLAACGHKDKSELEKEAMSYATKEGGNVKAVNCVTLDSDGDHYVTCTIFYGDRQKEEILCTIDKSDEGCKAK